MKLNGWQRLGIVESVAWSLFMLTAFLLSGNMPQEALWILLTVPIVALWTLGYAFVWIRSGFRGELDATNTIRGKNWLIGAALLGAIIAIAFFHSTPPAQHATLSGPWSAFRPVDPYDQFDRARPSN